MTIKALMIGTAAMFGCISVACVGCGPGRTARADKPSHGMLKGLRAEPLWMTRVGGLIGAAKYLKLDASPAWIYGATGHAFALNIHEALCPSGPTAWPAEKTDLLAANLGLLVETFQTHASEPDAGARQEAIWTKARHAIDDGLPCLAWWLDHGEWYVVVGYDEKGDYLFDDVGRWIGRKHHARLADNPTGMAILLTIMRGMPIDDDRTTVREALAFAVAHGAGEHSHDKWHTGLAGYDAWIKALSDTALIATDKTVGFGMAYNAQCWAETRRHAAPFLTGAAERLDDPGVSPMLIRAAKHYETVSAHLGLVARAFPFSLADREGMASRIADPAARAKAIAALTAARAAEQAALADLARIVKALKPGSGGR